MAAQNPPNFMFALAPALVNQGPIDYSTADGIKLWKGGIKPLAKELFTLEPHKFKIFLAVLADRAMTYGWGDILDVPIDAAVTVGPTRSIITHYGQVTLDQIWAHATIYNSTQTYAAQNNLMLYMCLTASIMTKVKVRAMIYHQDYHIGQNPIGMAFLKILIQEAHIDTRATVMHIRARLSALDSYILTIRCDITKLNTYVKDFIYSLMARKPCRTSWQTCSRRIKQ